MARVWVAQYISRDRLVNAVAAGPVLRHVQRAMIAHLESVGVGEALVEAHDDVDASAHITTIYKVEGETVGYVQSTEVIF